MQLKKRHSTARWIMWGAGLVVLLCGVYAAVILTLPAPKPQLHLLVQSGPLDTGKPADIPWPVGGGGALGSGTSVLAADNADQPMATASVAKVILALAVLRQKPLALAQDGPIITLTDQDVLFYQNELARGGSTVKVASGEQITEYQALQALLLPSGNNMAETLAVWAFGSEQQYTQYATTMLRAMGLTKTQLADSSGYSPNTVSTPAELVKIGEAALQNPVLAQIVAQKNATVPTAGQLINTNLLLGQGGVKGIKTGSTYAAGGCLLFAATRTVDGQPITLVGALQSMDDLNQAFNVTPILLDAGFGNFVAATGATAGQVVGTVAAPWSSPIAITAKQTVRQVVWAGTPLGREVTAAVTPSGVTGSVKVGDASTDLSLATPLPQPTPWWRLTHPVEMIRGR